MKYVNAKDILPENILKQLQTYAAGTLLYVPREGEEKSWGEVSGYRTYLLKRNRMILNFFQYGVSLDEISNTFGLALGTVKKIIYNKKCRTKLTFRPEVSSAEEYAECGLLEEWVHTYLLFKRKNRGFSDGLYLEDRYFIGPVKMPLTLFHRSSGPEEQLKWRVDATVFWQKVQIWTERIASGRSTPPLIIGYADRAFEINCDNPLFEVLTRTGWESYPVIIWMTKRTDYEEFRNQYGDFE